MSKSLKNFITITDMLNQYSSDDFRMFCLLNHYAARVQLDDNGLQQAQQLWTTIKNVGELDKEMNEWMNEWMNDNDLCCFI